MSVYLSLFAGTGDLSLLGTVQVIMIPAGFIAGQRMIRLQSAGIIAAPAGLGTFVFYILSIFQNISGDMES